MYLVKGRKRRTTMALGDDAPTGGFFDSVTSGIGNALSTITGGAVDTGQVKSVEAAGSSPGIIGATAASMAPASGGSSSSGAGSAALNIFGTLFSGLTTPSLPRGMVVAPRRGISPTTLIVAGVGAVALVALLARRRG